MGLVGSGGFIVGAAWHPISQARTRQQSDDAIGEGMKVLG